MDEDVDRMPWGQAKLELVKKLSSSKSKAKDDLRLCFEFANEGEADTARAQYMIHAKNAIKGAFDEAIVIYDAAAFAKLKDNA